MRYLLVVNPTSGGGKNLPRVAKVEKFFRKKGDELEVVLTSLPGEASTVARTRAAGFDAVIAAGGDGTLREVAAGLLGTSVPLGILPWGTGNVFARELGLPNRVKRLCRLIRRGREQTLDVGLADGQPFLLMASWGLDAHTLEQGTNPTLKRRWGVVAYVVAGLRSFLGYRSPALDVELADGTRDRGSFVVVSNTGLYGAFFRFFRHAHPADGVLDVLVYRHFGRWAFLGMVLQMVWHTWVEPRRHPRFLARHGVYRTTGVTVTPPGRPAQVDGDVVRGGVSRVVIAPGSLRVLVP